MFFRKPINPIRPVCASRRIANRGLSGKRRAFTLLELMVVVAIMLTLVIASVVKLQMSKDSRRSREAARLISIYLGSARNRAMANGRCCGVRFKCLTASSCSLNADQCEVPPTYSGDVTNAAVQIVEYNRDANYAYLEMYFPDGFNSSIIAPKDLIQVNGQSHWYTITDVDASNKYMSVKLDISRGQMHPWIVYKIWEATVAYSGGIIVVYDGLLYISIENKDKNGNVIPNIGKIPPQSPDFWRLYPMPPKVSYKILCAPSSTTGSYGGQSEPLQLPAGSVVDLGCSGINASYVGQQDFTILFSPTGSVDSVYYGASRTAVTDVIYLLVGKRERVGQSQSDPKKENESSWGNFQDIESAQWVTVNPISGQINSESVGSTAGGVPTSILDSRGFAAEAQGKGGQ